MQVFVDTTLSKIAGCAATHRTANLHQSPRCVLREGRVRVHGGAAAAAGSYGDGGVAAAPRTELLLLPARASAGVVELLT